MSETKTDRLCRTCMNDSNSHSPIYREICLEDSILFEVINDVCQLEVTEDDGLPEYICHDCLAKLSEFQKFKCRAHEVNVALQRMKEHELNSESESVPWECSKTEDESNFEQENDGSDLGSKELCGSTLALHHDWIKPDYNGTEHEKDGVNPPGVDQVEVKVELEDSFDEASDGREDTLYEEYIGIEPDDLAYNTVGFDGTTPTTTDPLQDTFLTDGLKEEDLSPEAMPVEVTRSSNHGSLEDKATEKTRRQREVTVKSIVTDISCNRMFIDKSEEANLTAETGRLIKTASNNRLEGKRSRKGKVYKGTREVVIHNANLEEKEIKNSSVGVVVQDSRRSDTHLGLKNLSRKENVENLERNHSCLEDTKANSISEESEEATPIAATGICWKTTAAESRLEVMRSRKRKVYKGPRNMVIQNTYLEKTEMKNSSVGVDVQESSWSVTELGSENLSRKENMEYLKLTHICPKVTKTNSIAEESEEVNSFSEEQEEVNAFAEEPEEDNSIVEEPEEANSIAEEPKEAKSIAEEPEEDNSIAEIGRLRKTAANNIQEGRRSRKSIVYNGTHKVVIENANLQKKGMMNSSGGVVAQDGRRSNTEPGLDNLSGEEHVDYLSGTHRCLEEKKAGSASRDSGWYFCDLCRKGYGDKYSLGNHWRRHMGVDEIRCVICEHTSSKIVARLSAEASSRGTACSMCGRAFKDEYCLGAHMRQSHLDEGKRSKSLFKEKRFFCDTCGNGFYRKDHLVGHLRIHTGEKPFRCEVCKKVFAREGNLKGHAKIHILENPHACHLCKKMFLRKTTLNAHLKRHQAPPEKKFGCTACGKRFTTKVILGNHLTTHSDEKPFLCYVCGKGFKLEAYLNAHVGRVHDRTTHYMCDICGKRFYLKAQFVDHVKLHGEARPYACEVCSKTFKTGNNFKAHLRTHSGSKPHSCSFCAKAFLSLGNLRAHLRIHTGERPFECPSCGKRFNQSSSLRRHSKSYCNREGTI